MISKFAIDEIEQMQNDGLKLKPREIIRLNALALRIEAARGRDVRHSSELLPRIAMIKKGVFFRQPTIGHELWISSALRWVDLNDYQTVLAVNCYALSRSADELCDSEDPDNVSKAVKEYADKMSEFTTDQLYTAVDYVKFGSDHITGESVDRPSDDEEDTTESIDIDWDECIAVGTLNEATAVLWGMSLAEMKRMTREQLNAAIYRAYWFHGKERHIEVAEKNALGDFYRAKSEIIERIAKENEHGTASSV